MSGHARTAADLARSATERLRQAGVPSPENDARLLLAHVLGARRFPWLDRSEVSSASVDRYAELVRLRAERVPLQHLTGKAYFGRLELDVGPGVFIPRPETEPMMVWASTEVGSRRVRLGRRQVVVDLCTGSGAIAKSIALDHPDAEVYAVELSEEAYGWAERNLADTEVHLVLADMAAALPELNGSVDVVVANPPYVPLEAYDSVAIEARDHDPSLAVFAGPGGLDAITVVAAVAARLLRAGGLMGCEHAEVQADSAARVVVDTEAFELVRSNRDLTGRPRYVTAVRNGRALAGWHG